MLEKELKEIKKTFKKFVELRGRLLWEEMHI